MAINKWEPWVWYPDIWKSKSAFYTWLRGCLRGAVWNKSPIKITFKNQACDRPPEGYSGRAKTGAYCALSGQWEGKSKLEVDHIDGNVPLREEEDILGFLKHLIPPPNSLQPVTKEAHKIKSYAEKHGMTFEEAFVEKRTIAIMRSGEDKKWLIERGVSPGGNAGQRRKQVREVLLKGGS